MTVILYFWFQSFGLFFPLALYTSIMIAFNVFLIKDSSEKDRNLRYKGLLRVAGIVNIISVLILFFFPISYGSTSSLTPEERLVINCFFYILPTLIINVPRIFTFGALFIILGNRIENDNQKYLKYTGVFWLVYSVWASIFLISPIGNMPNLAYILVSYHDPYFNPYLQNILIYIFGLGSIFNLFGVIYLLIYSYLENDQTLKIVGLIYLIGNALLSLGMIPYYIERIFS
ncbi:MAG: hypothetical protein EU542_01240 [Promethearchaeota archaeon]|nr:MAG: hypothetical protein EU542_01240 [Candidatus Lokiarchaeota archaeon]